MNESVSLTEWAELNVLLKKVGWAATMIGWFRDQFIRARSQGKTVLLKEGYMGGTAVFMLPKGEVPRMRFRQDIEEKCPVPRGLTELRYGGEDGAESKGSTEEAGRKKADNQECVRSVPQARKDRGKGRKRGRPRKSEVGIDPVTNDDSGEIEGT